MTRDIFGRGVVIAGGVSGMEVESGKQSRSSTGSGSLIALSKMGGHFHTHVAVHHQAANLLIPQ